MNLLIDFFVFLIIWIYEIRYPFYAFNDDLKKNWYYTRVVFETCIWLGEIKMIYVIKEEILKRCKELEIY